MAATLYPEMTDVSSPLARCEERTTPPLAGQDVCQEPGCDVGLWWLGGGRPRERCSKHSQSPSAGIEDKRAGRGLMPQCTGRFTVETQTRGKAARPSASSQARAARAGGGPLSAPNEAASERLAASAAVTREFALLKMAVGLGLADGDPERAARISGVLLPDETGELRRPTSAEAAALAFEVGEAGADMDLLRDGDRRAVVMLGERFQALNMIMLLESSASLAPKERASVLNIMQRAITAMGGDRTTYPEITVQFGLAPDAPTTTPTTTSTTTSTTTPTTPTTAPTTPTTTAAPHSVPAGVPPPWAARAVGAAPKPPPSDPPKAARGVKGGRPAAAASRGRPLKGAALQRALERGRR